MSTDDQGFLLGLALFETVLWRDGVAYFLEDHLERLGRGANRLGVSLPLPWDLEAVMYDYAERLAEHEVALRVTLTRGVPDEGATVVLGARAIDRPLEVVLWPALHGPGYGDLKSTNRLQYVLAREKARQKGAWEALIVGPDGVVCEGTISNVWVHREGSWVTPDDSSGALPGVTRNRLLALGREDEKLRLTEGRVQIGDLARCTEVCLSNSTGRILPVTEVLGRAAALPGRHGAGYRQLVAAMDSIEARYAQGARARRAGGRGPRPGG